MRVFFNIKEMFCVNSLRDSSQLSQLKLTRFGAAQIVNGFQINDMHVSITQTDDSSFIYQHSSYVAFECDRSERMRGNGISFFQRLSEVVDVHLRRSIGNDDVIGVGANLRRHRKQFHAYVS